MTEHRKVTMREARELGRILRAAPRHPAEDEAARHLLPPKDRRRAEAALEARANATLRHIRGLAHKPSECAHPDCERSE